MCTFDSGQFSYLYDLVAVVVEGQWKSKPSWFLVNTASGKADSGPVFTGPGV